MVYLKGEDLADTAGRKGLMIPHMGWNSLDLQNRRQSFLKTFRKQSYVYFVHSYYLTGSRIRADCKGNCSVQNIRRISMLPWRAGNVFACQFHPEKSRDIGLQILREFCRTVRIRRMETGDVYKKNHSLSGL